ncbi:MAG: Rieske 2Fe-2S domain-containing protein [Acidimicrobiales bacterium]
MTDPFDVRNGPPANRTGLSGTLASPEGTLLLLRAFLGVTFTFAGLQKLANPNFFSPIAPGSFQEQLRGSIITSPLHHLLDPALHAPVVFAVVVAVGEIAVGLGTLVGLFGRVAATGGALLSLSFFLTVSFRDNPYYYGADIVFLFAWTPFVLGGSGAFSLDGVYARRAERARAALSAATPRGGMTKRKLAASKRQTAELERRTFLQKAAAAGVVALTGFTLGGLVSALGRFLHSARPSGAVASLPDAGALGKVSPATGGQAPAATGATSSPAAPTSTAAAPVPKGTRIGPAADVPVGSAASFTDPAKQVPALVVQIKSDDFRAFSAVCPHAGCTVQFDGANDVFACPCHGSVFSATTGAVLQGPAPTGLSPIPVALGPNGQLYVDG